MNAVAHPVCYVVGKGRSGSTLLDGALGQLPGWFSAGELWRLWDWGVGQGYRCGCGTPIPDCEVWKPVLSLVSGQVDVPEPAAAIRGAFSWLRPMGLHRRRTDEAVRLFEALYTAVRRVTGATVIVDSSKWPLAPGIRPAVTGVDPFVVQLVRNPRAVAFSWSRRKNFIDRSSDEEMPTFGPIASALSWSGRNVLGEYARRHVGPRSSMLLRYEDFVADPGGTLAAIAERCGVPAEPDAPDGHVRLGPHHMIGGNPGRVASGLLPVRPDDEWRSAQRGWSRLAVDAVALPLAGRYGYR